MSLSGSSAGPGVVPENPTCPVPLNAQQSPVMLKPEDLERFRTILKKLQVRVRGDVRHLEEDAFSGKESEHGSSNHMAEMGTDAWEDDFSLRMVENDEEFLKEISTALERIDNGRLVCVKCALKPACRSRKRRSPKRG